MNGSVFIPLFSSATFSQGPACNVRVWARPGRGRKGRKAVVVRSGRGGSVWADRYAGGHTGLGNLPSAVSPFVYASPQES